MDTLYWAGEYGKVFCAYMFLMFIWPSVVFSSHLKKKDKIYRFSFCVTVQIVIINSVVLMLGLCHILNQWIVVCIFYGIFIVSVVRKIKLQYCFNRFEEFYKLITGTYGLKLFLIYRIKKIGIWIKKIYFKFWNSIRSHFLEYAVLCVLVIFGMIYFSYGVFQDFNYGSGDMYIHHQWINGLLEGQIFYDGVYPEGMHCFLYCLHILFGIKLYNCVLLLAGIHISVILISVYVFLKEIFHWKYTPFFVLVMFLTIDLMCIREVDGMSRLQWALPQEFAMFTQFLCALFLIRYLRSSHTVIAKNILRRILLNENLLLFMLSLAASLAIHFYSTIMAVILCIPFFMYYLKKLLKIEKFLLLLVAILCGFIIAAIPMAGALASGIPFQGSIRWAVSIMNNEDSKDEDIGANGTELLEEKEIDNVTALREKLEKICFVIYQDGYVVLYQEERAVWIIGFTGLAIVLWLVYRAIRLLHRVWTKRKQEETYFNGYLPVIISSVLFMIIYVSPELGLPQLIAGVRLCTMEQLLLLTIIAMPADMIFTLLGRLCIDLVLQVLSIGLTVGIYCFTVITGSYHGYLRCELSRYNAAVQVTDSIINHFPRDSFTIVSCTDELYQVIQYGYHEELLTFLQEIDSEEYKLPTEYVFIYVEKKPIQYAQSHFFQGPAWLGNEKYIDMHSESASQCPEINASDISMEQAQKDILFYGLLSDSYSVLESRTILESKAYLWCQNFMKLFPFEMQIYYEDEDFVCYYFKQNPYALYDLAIDGWDRTEGIEW